MSGAVKSPLAQWAFMMNPVSPITDIGPMPAELRVEYGGSAYVDGNPLPATPEPDGTPKSITARMRNEIAYLIRVAGRGGAVAQCKLIGIGEPAVEPLIKTLGDKDAIVRRTAAIILGKIGDRRAVEPLIKALRDKNNDVRLWATRALGEIGDARAVEPLMQALGDKDRDIRSGAASVLGEIGDERAVEPLIKALKHEDVVYVRIVIRALAMIGDERAIGPLVWMFETCHQGVRFELKYALVEFGERALPQLLGGLYTWNRLVRQGAEEVLEAL